MPDSLRRAHVKPFVYDTRTTKALHFSFGETQSRMTLGEPDSLELEYTQTMMGFLLFHPAPLRIGMIGLGGGSLAKFCHRHLPGSEILVVEINPHVIALRDEFRIPPQGARFEVVLDDGARYLSQTHRRFEVLLLDGYDASGLPPQLSSPEFYGDCFRCLEPHGLLVANFHSGDPGFPQQLEHIRAVFGAESARVVDNGRHGNAVVFAACGQALSAPRPGPQARPPAIDGPGWASLQGAIARILTAMKEAGP